MRRDHAFPVTHPAIVSEIGLRFALRSYESASRRGHSGAWVAHFLAVAVEHLVDPLWAQERADVRSR